MSRIEKIFERLRRSRWAPAFFALLGAALYLAQAARIARLLVSSLDEGNYLVKGLLFVTGVYTPFQPYGPLTNKMPLAFLIPGMAQSWFGPGLQTGRSFAILLGLLMLLALWLTSRRLGGPWWAAAIVWVVALNPGLIRYYTESISQGLTAAVLAWVLAMVLGQDRSTWAILFGSILAALLVMIRENMLPVVGFVVLYLWWEQGWRKAGIAGLAAFSVLVVFHIVYWPGIMTNWATQLPDTLTPFLQPFRRAVSGTSVWAPELGGFSRLFAYWDGMRYHFAEYFGLFAGLILWPRRAEWRSSSHFRIAVSLALLLAILALAHLWAALLKDYCVFCFGGYLAFFTPAGLILLVAVASSWRKSLPAWRRVLAALLTVIYATGVGFGAHQELDDWILNWQIPRTRNMRILPGTNDLWRSLTNKFGWSYDFQKWLLPTATACAVALLFVALFALLYYAWLRKRTSTGPGYLLLTFSLLLGILLSPTVVFANPGNGSECGNDVITAYEEAGAHLASLIPPGSLVHWRGGNSPTPLLYIPQVRIFPPQLNNGYTLRKGGDADMLYRSGYWNAALSNIWLEEADFALIEGRAYTGQFDQTTTYQEMEPTVPIYPCRPGSEIRIFRRIQ